MNKQMEPQKKLSLTEFLSKCSSLDRLLDSSYKLSSETRENIAWYCDYRVHQYYQQYKNELEFQDSLKTKVRLDCIKSRNTAKIKSGRVR